MAVGITGIAVRLLGRIVYIAVDAIASIIAKPKTSQMIALISLHLEELPAVLFSPVYPALLLLSIELCFLTGMNNYSEIFKKSMEQNGDDNDDSVNASANAAGSRDNSNN
ncbi:uncharacterized protein LOC142802743 [Rhipicephalus microplus]|uniref:uncharacterized protein LOC142791222 n=1 Tax=Rhipicephalus microplus TaxID=6941 RepID=UPI003F6B7B77